ncbi:MAG: HEAT repeat domain-containing protein, partial [Phycisphaerae bacterium]
IVRSVTSIRDPKELIGQKERLKALVNHPEPDVRRPVYWALGKTGELSLVPTILKGLRDSSVDVNVEAEQALRFIARRPAGFGYPVNPLDGAETADERTKTQKVRAWRDKAVKSWLDWYLSVQSFEDQQTVNQVELFRLKNPDAVQ